MVCVQLCDARRLVATAAEAAAKVNELANRCGEILAEFIQRRIPAYGEFVFFLPAFH